MAPVFLFEPVGIESLEYPNLFYLNAAQGWLELGNAAEALSELAHIESAQQIHPAVLDVRWQVAVKEKRWADALQVSELLCQAAPGSAFSWIHRSYCLHELKRTREAWNCLLPVVERFPAEWLICYNLACYACQLGWLEEGQSWFSRAVELGDAREVNQLAEDDPDLRPLFKQPR